MPAWCAALLLIASLLPGCDTTPPVFVPDNDPSIGQLETAGVTYREVAEGYNATVSHFDTLFLRTYVRMVWQETRADGSTRIRREAGDGKFLFRAPSDTVLTIEKISKVYLWAGSNASQYWLFDQVDDDNKIAYIGSYDASEPLAGSHGRHLPIAFRPDAMPYLLGLVALDPSLVSEVFLYEGQYLVEPKGLGLRMLIDPGSFRPTRVDLLDAHGWSVIVCQMTGRYGVEVEGLPGHRYPVVCDDAELFITGQQSRLSIEMIAATTNDRRIRDQLFNLDTLIDALEPDEIVDLDQQ
ncbi:MAG: hypothetical protein AAGA29_03975 [Planctomycetota bacterium]